MRRLTVLALLTVAGCGGGDKPAAKRTLDTDAVARAIAASVKDQRDLDATVVCPNGIPQRKGYEFACLATYEGGRNTFTVKQTDDDGHVTYAGR